MKPFDMVFRIETPNPQLNDSGKTKETSSFLCTLSHCNHQCLKHKQKPLDQLPVERKCRKTKNAGSNIPISYSS